jgi:death-on-curing protein
MTPVVYLDTEDLLALTRLLGAGPVRDLGLLESAAARPRTDVFGHEAYPNLTTKAAALMHSLAKNHPLVDGNKRLAWLAALTFLDINGVRVTLSHDDAFDFVMAVASGELDDVVEIAAVLDRGTTPRSTTDR